VPTLALRWNFPSASDFRPSRLNRVVFDDDYMTTKWRRRFDRVARAQNGKRWRRQDQGKKDADNRMFHNFPCLSHQSCHSGRSQIIFDATEITIAANNL